MIINDNFTAIQRDPERFVDEIQSHMHRGGSFGMHGCHPVATVARTQHADVHRLYLTHGNSLWDVSPYNTDLTDWLQHRKENRALLRREFKAARSAMARLTQMMKEMDEKEAHP